MNLDIDQTLGIQLTQGVMTFCCVIATAVSMALIKAGRSPRNRDHILVLSGWGMLVESMILWWIAHGVVTGSCYGLLMMFSLYACARWLPSRIAAGSDCRAADPPAANRFRHCKTGPTANPQQSPY